jgi:hypothetical protein
VVPQTTPQATAGPSDLTAHPRHTSELERRETRFQGLVATWLVAYTVLWLTEGIARKWLLPGLSDPLYFSRDLITVLALAFALTGGVHPSKRRWITLAIGWTLAVSALACGQAIVTGQPALALLVGAVTYISPVTAICLLLCVTHKEKLLRRVQGVVLGVLPIQATLTIVQTSSPESSAWNTVGDTQVGFTTADDVVRATGTFIAPSVLTLYIVLAVALLLVRLVSRGFRPLSWDVILLPSAVAVVALGGSRGAVFQTSLVLIAALIWGVIVGGLTTVGLARMIGAAGATAGFTYAVLRGFPRVANAFATRFEQAAQSEDPSERILGGATGYLSIPEGAPWWGDGLGSHTLAGLAAGSRLDWIEVELTRWVAEMGPFGLILAIARQLATIALLVVAWQVTRRSGSPLVWLVAIALAPPALTGSVVAPSAQAGFLVVSVALIVLGWPAPDGVDPRPTGARGRFGHTVPTASR